MMWDRFYLTLGGAGVERDGTLECLDVGLGVGENPKRKTKPEEKWKYDIKKVTWNNLLVREAIHIVFLHGMKKEVGRSWKKK